MLKMMFEKIVQLLFKKTFYSGKTLKKLFFYFLKIIFNINILK